MRIATVITLALVLSSAAVRAQTKIPGIFLHHLRRAAVLRRRKVTLRENALAPTVQHHATPLVVLNGFVVASDCARTTTTRSAATSTASRPAGAG
jgi:hypothetical protein